MHTVDVLKISPQSDPVEIREFHIKPIISLWTSGMTFAVFCLSRDKVFLSGGVMLGGHLSPQRQNSFQFIAQTKTVTGVMQMCATGPNSNCLAEISNQDLKTKINVLRLK